MSFPRYSTYKASGIPWLQEVPSHWKLIAPKRVMGSCSGGTLIKGDCADEPAEGLFPAFSASGQDVWIERPNHQASAIVLSAVGARCGKSFKADGEWGVVANTHCLFPDSEQSRDFFWYLTNNEDWWEKGGTAQPFVKVKETLDRIWCLPPSNEQSAIAKFLDHETAKIDALIAEQQRLIELLQEKRQAVISHAVTKGLNPNAPMKDSGVEWLGEIPGHWAIVRLKYLAQDKDGVQMGPFGALLTNLETEETGYKVYGQENIISHDLSLGSRWITEARYHELERYRLESGDIAVTRKGSLGNAHLIDSLPQPGIADSDTIRLRCRQQTLIPLYLHKLLHEAQYINEQIAQTKRGSVLPGLNTYTISNLVVALPPLEEQLDLLDYIEATCEQIANLSNKVNTASRLLQERRSALISAAVTGQIDVRGLATEEEP